MVEEDTKRTLKSTETSEGCWPECMHLWHQTFFFFVCQNSKLKIYMFLLVFWRSRIYQFRLSSNLFKPWDTVYNDRYFVRIFFKMSEGFRRSSSVGGNLGRTSVGWIIRRFSSNWFKLGDIVLCDRYFLKNLWKLSI